MKYKLLVLDVDGTLLNDKKEITPRTHAALLKAQQMDGYILLNPGSVSIPEEGNPATYAVLENSIFTIKDFDGNTVREMRLP